MYDPYGHKPLKVVSVAVVVLVQKTSLASLVIFLVVLFGGGGRQQQRQRRGSDLRYVMELTLEEAVKGVKNDYFYCTSAV